MIILKIIYNLKIAAKSTCTFDLTKFGWPSILYKVIHNYV